MLRKGSIQYHHHTAGQAAAAARQRARHGIPRTLYPQLSPGDAALLLWGPSAQIAGALDVLQGLGFRYRRLDRLSGGGAVGPPGYAPGL